MPFPFNLAAALGFAVLSIGSATAANAGKVVPANETIPAIGSCRFDLPETVSTIVYLASSGRDHSDFRIPRNIERVGRQKIVLPHINLPAFVVLSGSEAMQWDLRIRPGAKIAGILVLGIGDQVVTGVPPGVMVGFSIRSNDRRSFSNAGQGCPDLAETNGGFDLKSIERILHEDFKRPIDQGEIVEAMACPYQECRPNPGGRLWHWLTALFKAPTNPQASDVRASGRFIVRNDAR
jgi:hypothetical protein